MDGLWPRLPHGLGALEVMPGADTTQRGGEIRLGVAGGEGRGLRGGQEQVLTRLTSRLPTNKQ